MKDQTEIPEALRLVEWFEEGGGFQQGTKAPHKWVLQAEQELRRLHAESELHLQELRSYRITVENREARIAELEAQLAAAQQGVQPVAWLAEYVDQEGNSKWYVTTHKELAAENDMHGAPKPLYTHPTTQGLGAQTIKHISALSELVRMPNAEHFADAHNAAVRHLRAIATQAKQGGAA